MSDKFNTYHWVDFKVNKRDQVPLVPHFQALVFGQRTEYTPAYDIHDGPTTTPVPTVDLYVFKERQHLDMFVDDAARSGASFVFYHVNALGKATVKVEVDTEVG